MLHTHMHTHTHLPWVCLWSHWCTGWRAGPQHHTTQAHTHPLPRVWVHATTSQPPHSRRSAEGRQERTGKNFEQCQMGTGDKWHLERPEWDWQVGCWEGGRALGRWNGAERQASPEQYLVDFHPIITPEQYSLSQHHISFPHSIYFHLFYLVVCLITLDSHLYECSGMSVFPPHPPCPQHLAKCLVLKRHSINFCWMNMHTQTCIHTYVLMGIVAYRQGCKHHTIQKCKIIQSLQVRQAGIWFC